MMPNASGIAHAACRDDDVESGQPGDGFAFVDGLGETQMRRAQQPADIDVGVETRRMLPKHFGCMNGKRGVQKDRRRRHFAALHQIDEVDDQLLGALDGKGRDEQGAFCLSCVADLDGETLTACLGCRGWAI